MNPCKQLFHHLPITALAVVVSACGGTTKSGDATLNALVAHAPTSTSTELEMAGASTVAPTLPYLSTPVAAMTPTAAGNVIGGDACHPHLFARTAEVVWRVNAIFHRQLRHVDALVNRHPDLLAGDTATWTETGRGIEVQRKFTISRSADGLTYTFELDLAPAGPTPPVWVKVFGGTETDASSGAVIETTGSMKFDYDALHQVLPAEPLTGAVDLTFDRVTDPSRRAPGLKRAASIAFHGFTFGPMDPHGPRSGTYVHLSEPGTGGLMTFQDSVVLLCPANPSGLAADTSTVSRWYHAADGSVHGRSDAKATGGQVPSGDTWLGVTCHSGAMGDDPATSTAAEYWMMKLEDVTGATVQGSARESGAGVACDSAFGPVPSLTDDATDFDFTRPVTFPNAW